MLKNNVLPRNPGSDVDRERKKKASPLPMNFFLIGQVMMLGNTS